MARIRENRADQLLFITLFGAILLIGARIPITGEPHFLFLIWNMFLAIVPWQISRWLVQRSETDRLPVPLLFPAIFLWLLFLPNAPYIVTDFLHLKGSGISMMYDALMIGSCALVGLVATYRSLFQIERLMAPYFGQRGASIFSGIVLVLCGYGVYIGRVLRLNSWDLFTDPVNTILLLLSDFVLSTSRYSPITVTVVVGVYLILGYLVIKRGLLEPVWRALRWKSARN